MIVSKLKLYNMEMCDSLEQVISILNTDLHEHNMSKISKESNKKGRALISPKSLNAGYSRLFKKQGFAKHRPFKDTSCEIDFFKDGIGIEIQLGKYAYVIYDIYAKLRPCFFNDTLKFGVEVLPTKVMYDKMSNGVANFETEIKKLDRCSIDFPLAVLGVEPTNEIELPSLEHLFSTDERFSYKENNRAERIRNQRLDSLEDLI